MASQAMMPCQVPDSTTQLNTACSPRESSAVSLFALNTSLKLMAAVSLPRLSQVIRTHSTHYSGAYLGVG